MYDAAFFWKEDQLKTLDQRAEELKAVTYQEQLGSVYDKVQRIKKLALWMTDLLDCEEIKPQVSAQRTSLKLTWLQTWFTHSSDVQGVMGREYARKGR